MTRTTRRLIFYLLCALFLLLGGLVVLYAQGWRVDFKTWRPEKVGAIFVQSFPVDANIMLDNTSIPNRAGFLSRGTLITDLFPRNYELTLTHDGYADWHENVQALPSLVTELKYAVLVPKTSTAVATGSIKNFLFASNELILQDADDRVTWRGNLIGQGDVLDGNTNANAIIIKNSLTGRYSLYDLAKSTSTDLSAAITGAGIDPKTITSLTIDPYNATNIIGASIHRVWVFDSADRTASFIERAPIGTIVGSYPVISPSLIAWTRLGDASNTSAVALYDKFTKVVTITSSTLPGESVITKWIHGGLLGLLQADGSLYTYDVGSQQFQKLADDVKDFEPASNGNALAALENKSVEIFPFTDTMTYHRFNVPDVQAAQRLFWYKDFNHLFVQYPDHVAFLDIDDLSLRNFITVAQGTAPFYDDQKNALYLIDFTRTLVRFDFPG